MNYKIVVKQVYLITRMVHSDMRHFFCDVISLFLLYHKMQEM